MKKLYLDENMTAEVVAPLTSIYRTLLVRTAEQEHLRGVDDETLFEDLRQRDFDAILTFDFQQLENEDERRSLRAAGLHWIGVPPVHARGVHNLALLVGIVVPGMQHVLDDWRDAPSIYRLTGADRPETVRPRIEPL